MFFFFSNVFLATWARLQQCTLIAQTGSVFVVAIVTLCNLSALMCQSSCHLQHPQSMLMLKMKLK